jgi:hypothetical protein
VIVFKAERMLEITDTVTPTHVISISVWWRCPSLLFFLSNNK